LAPSMFLNESNIESVFSSLPSSWSLKRAKPAFDRILNQRLDDLDSNNVCTYQVFQKELTYFFVLFCCVARRGREQSGSCSLFDLSQFFCLPFVRDLGRQSWIQDVDFFTFNLYKHYITLVGLFFLIRRELKSVWIFLDRSAHVAHIGRESTCRPPY
jgi:hypothetical protein